MAILTPAGPRIPTQLPDWITEADDDTILEIDNQSVRSADWSMMTMVSADASRLEDVDMLSAVLKGFELTDVEAVKLQAAGLQAYKARLLRAAVTDSRITGAEFAEGQFEDCVFRNVKFDEAGFRFAVFKRVRFENCVLRAADFSNARFTHVSFAGCDLSEAGFISAVCSNVDVTGQDITGVKGLLGLKGSTISDNQLLQLAPLLASELGFKVSDQDYE